MTAGAASRQMNTQLRAPDIAWRPGTGAGIVGWAGRQPVPTEVRRNSGQLVVATTLYIEQSPDD